MAEYKDNLLGEANSFLEVLEQVSHLAPLDKPVLIIGERGTGKELIASRWFEGPKTVGAVHMSVSPKEMVLTLLDRNGTVLDTVSVKAKRK